MHNLDRPIQDRVLVIMSQTGHVVSLLQNLIGVTLLEIDLDVSLLHAVAGPVGVVEGERLAEVLGHVGGGLGVHGEVKHHVVGPAIKSKDFIHHGSP